MCMQRGCYRDGWYVVETKRADVEGKGCVEGTGVLHRVEVVSDVERRERKRRGGGRVCCEYERGSWCEEKRSEEKREGKRAREERARVL